MNLQAPCGDFPGDRPPGKGGGHIFSAWSLTSPSARDFSIWCVRCTDALGLWVTSTELYPVTRGDQEKISKSSLERGGLNSLPKSTAVKLTESLGLCIPT